MSDMAGEEERKRCFVTNLQRLMKERGFRQVDLADALGTPKSHAGQWFHGNVMPKDFTLSRIADFLGVEIEELLSDRYIDKREPSKGCKTDCFSYISATFMETDKDGMKHRIERAKDCAVLRKLYCMDGAECPFYKTTWQLERDRAVAAKRNETL